MKQIDLFCGIGAFSLAAKKYGIKTVFACDSDKYACSVYKYHNSDTELYEGDIRNVKGSDIISKYGRINIITAGIPCFNGETLIFTKRGLISIKDVLVGDEVFTHRKRWKRVNKLFISKDKSTRAIKAQGIIETITTDEHPYYCRRRKNVWNNKKRTYERKFDEPKWIEAKSIKHHHIGRICPTAKPIEGDKDFWWVVGRYVADGWLVNRKDRGNGQTCRVIISAGRHDEKYVQQRIQRKFNCCRTEERTVIKYHITNKQFGEFLKPTGRKSYNKEIPISWFGMSDEQAKAFLDGYLTGDGNVYKGGISASTTSKKLAISISLLYQRVYRILSTISLVVPSPKGKIENRIINQRPYYTVRFPKRNRSGFVENEIAWGKVKKNESTNRRETVYNIEVEEDNSYTANGAIVHNCQAFSIAGQRKGFEDISRGTLFFEVARLANEIRSDYIFIENVKGLINHEGGKTLAIIFSRLEELGYDIEWQVCNSRYFGVAQNRERVYIIGHFRERNTRQIFPIRYSSEKLNGLFGAEQIKGQRISSKISSKERDNEFPESRRTGIGQSDKGLKQVGNVDQKGHNSVWGRVYSTEGIGSTIRANGGGFGGKTGLYAVAVRKRDQVPKAELREDKISNSLSNGIRIRRLTPIECERLQSFPDNFTKYGINKNNKIEISDTQRYKMLGNSITVNVLREIYKKVTS